MLSRHVLPHCALASLLGAFVVVQLSSATSAEADESMMPASAAREDLETDRNRLRELALRFANQRQYDQAVAAAEEMLAIDVRLTGNQGQNMADWWRWVAHTHLALGHVDAAVAAFERESEALAAIEDGKAWQVVNSAVAQTAAAALAELTPRQRQDVCRAAKLKQLAAESRADGKAKAAVESLDEALALIRGVYPPDGLQAADLETALADAHVALEAFDKALPLFERALAAREARLGAAHPETAYCLHQAGWSAQNTGDTQAARRYLERAVAMRRESLGDHLHTALSCEVTGHLLTRLDEPVAAINYYEEALRLRELLLDPNDSVTLATKLYLAGPTLYSGDSQRAKELLTAVLGEMQADDPNRIRAFEELSRVCIQRAEYTEAHDAVSAALELRKATGDVRSVAYAGCLRELAVVEAYLENYDQAIAVYHEALSLYLAHVGENEPVVLRVKRDLAKAYFFVRRYDEARRYSEETVNGYAEQFGPSDLQTNEARQALGRVLIWSGAILEAAPVLEEALHVSREVSGPEAAVTVVAMRELASCYERLGRLRDARKLFSSIAQLAKEQHGAESVEYANALLRLASPEAAFDAPSALHMRQQAAAILQREFGSDDPNVAPALTGLASSYGSMGNRAKALQLLQRVVEIRRRHAGYRRLEYATALTEWGEALRSQGEMRQAERVLTEAWQIFRDAFGPGHVDCLAQVVPLAKIRQSLGETESAIALLQEATSAALADAGAASPYLIYAVKELALLYGATGGTDVAVSLLKRRAEIVRSMYGPNDRYAAASILAAAFEGVHGDADQAVRSIREAIEIRQRRKGPNYQGHGDDLFLLGFSLVSAGRLDEADAAFAEVQAAQLKQEFTSKNEEALLLLLRALVSAHRSDEQQARRFIRSCLETREVAFLNVFTQVSGNRMSSFAETVAMDMDVAASLYLDSDPDFIFQWTLRRKANVFETMRLLRSAEAVLRRDPQAARKFVQLRNLKDRLSRIAWSPGNDAEPSLAQEIQMLEADLNSQLAQYLNETPAADESIASVRAKLGAGEALVEFVKFQPIDLNSKNLMARQAARYLALVVRPAPQSCVELIDLGPATEVESLVDQLVEHFDEASRQIGIADAIEFEQRYQRIGGALTSTLFAPLTSALGDARKIWLGLDGRLHDIPFESLVDEQGRYLIELGYQFAYVNSGRDLLLPREATGSGVAVFARPDYRLDYEDRLAVAQELFAEERPLLAATESFSIPAAAIGDAVTRGEQTRAGWRDLRQAAALEGQDAVAAFRNANFGPVEDFTRGRALEEAVKRLANPRVLVLVTHGDFLEDEPASTPVSPIGLAQERLRSAQNPLLRSYLVLTGANQIGEQIPDDVQVDDGWLTALEIAQLDLHGTDLVILSACTTNRGQTSNGQAVAGMRSAFLFAGARTIVGSLFEVPNVETRQLLKPFYEGVAAGEGKLAALNAAKLAFIKDRREREGAAHPFYWASFILVGDPGLP